MVDLKHYLEDGAGWQARMVLAYLQGKSGYMLYASWNGERKEYDAKLKVGRYENGREQGYTICCTANGANDCWSFAEHRSTDQIRVIHAKKKMAGYPDNTPTAEFMLADGDGGEQDWLDAYFGVGEAKQCGDYLAKKIAEFVEAAYAKES